MNEQEPKFDEEWSRWEPIKGAHGNYYVQNIIYGKDDLKLILISTKKDHFVELVFPYTISAIRIADEGVVFMLFEKLFVKYGDDFYINWTFFKVENSDCLKWLSEGTAGFSEGYGLTHYVVKGLNVVIDIVTNDAPIVKILDNYRE